MEKEDIIDVADFEKSYIELEFKVSSIERNLQALVFDYANKISGRLDTPQISNTRSGLALRLKSILYLVRLMRQEKTRIIKDVEGSNSLPGYYSANILMSLVDDQKTLFDSVLYHLSSVYDYYAVLSNYIYDHNSGLKWNGLVKSAYDTGNTKISVLHKRSITESHKLLVNSIFSHRSYLIHKSTSNPSAYFTSIAPPISLH